MLKKILKKSLEIVSSLTVKFLNRFENSCNFLESSNHLSSVIMLQSFPEQDYSREANLFSSFDSTFLFSSLSGFSHSASPPTPHCQICPPSLLTSGLCLFPVNN